MRMLSRVEGMPLASLQQGVPWNWVSTAEYLDALDGTTVDQRRRSRSATRPSGGS